MRSRELFTKYVDGRFGEEIIKDYIHILSTFPRRNIHPLAKQVFKMALEAIGEAWRRFVLATSGAPCQLFRLMDSTHEDFLKGYAALKEAASKCRQCIDLEFTMPVLGFLKASEGDPRLLQQRVSQVKELLKSISVHGPISSDLVECLHGFCQKLLQRGRGGVLPSDEGAQQRVLWSLITASYAKDEQFIMDHFGDPQQKRRCKAYGHKGKNQYTQFKYATQEGEDAGDPEPPRQPASSRRPRLTLDKLERLFAFGQDSDPGLSRPRKLCGFSPLQ